MQSKSPITANINQSSNPQKENHENNKQTGRTGYEKIKEPNHYEFYSKDDPGMIDTFECIVTKIN